MRLQKRSKHHTLLLIVSALLLTVFYLSVPGNNPKYLWSMATGYTSIILLGMTLAIGPFNIIMKNMNPVSSDIRRDIGIWCGVIGVAHVIIGIQVHMGNIFLYFVKSVEGADKYQLRSDLFGSANYTGAIATIILLILLALSNDLSLRLLKPRLWKNLQRLSYASFILILAHGIMYQIIEERTKIIIAIFALIMILPVIFQLGGISRFKKYKSR